MTDHTQHPRDIPGKRRRGQNINVAGRVNKKVVLNIGNSGSAQAASARQDTSIVQRSGETDEPRTDSESNS